MSQSRTRAKRSMWEHFPIWMILAMGTVVAVNARLITLAVTTFPGAATSDDFDSSNSYNKVLDAAAKQQALGWRVQVRADGGAPVISVTGRDGVPIAAKIEGSVRRPLGDSMDQAARLVPDGHGGLVVKNILAPGQWDLLLHIAAGGGEMRVTRRVIVQ